MHGVVGTDEIYGSESEQCQYNRMEKEAARRETIHGYNNFRSRTTGHKALFKSVGRHDLITPSSSQSSVPPGTSSDPPQGLLIESANASGRCVEHRIRREARDAVLYLDRLYGTVHWKCDFIMLGGWPSMCGLQHNTGVLGSRCNDSDSKRHSLCWVVDISRSLVLRFSRPF